jgi:hypothetical protein
MCIVRIARSITLKEKLTKLHIHLILQLLSLFSHRRNQPAAHFSGLTLSVGHASLTGTSL